MNRSLLVFLCYASEDKPAAQVLHDKLAADGFDVWFDKEDILPGQNWDTEIRKAVQAADVVIICLTKRSVAKAGYIQKEIKIALEAAKEKPDGTIYLIPARLEACDVPDSLGDFEWVDLFFDGKEFEKYEYKRLLQSLREKTKSIIENANATKNRPEAEKLIREASRKRKVTRSRGRFAPEVVAALIGAAALVIAAIMPSTISWLNSYSKTATPVIISQVPQVPPVPNDTLTPVLSSAVTSAPSVPPESTYIDSKGTEMALIPSGEFTMGRSDLKPKDQQQNEKPAHAVFLKDYYIDKYEVTNGAYKICVQAGECKAPYSLNSSARTKGYYSNPDYANFPVIFVDWFMARDYCKWRGVRLPTEAEWEKAARSTNDKHFPWGGNTIVCAFAQYGACGKDTVEVGSHPDGISPYGVHDLSGNVWEWVSDWYQYDYYEISPREDPQGPASGIYRVARGGAWNSESIQLWVTYRNRFYPNYNAYNLGFRCAKDP
ncbi:MAG: SUMF1/EgtB/PvdO family nonheme iron enzyme [Chloroflexota bacterium]